MSRTLVLAALCLAAFATGTTNANARTIFVVNDKRDLPDADINDGVCDADLAKPGLQITLRAAIMHANFTAGGDIIQLPKGKFKLKRKTVTTDTDATGDLDVTDDLNINGAGSNKTIIDAKKLGDRAFHVDDKTLVIQDVTIRNGRAVDPAQDGGGILAENTAILHVFNTVITKCKCTGDGGGIAVLGSDIIIEGVLISSNKALGAGAGGGIALKGSTVDLEESTFAKNKCGSAGGGLMVENSAFVLLNSTVSGNKATNGGGVWTKENANLTFSSCTIAENQATAGSGLFEDTTGAMPVTITFVNTILANDPLTNYAGDGVATNGGNIDTGITCLFVNITDQSTTDPKLRKLANNGGPTPTHAIKKTSKAVDHGIDAFALPKDQRGVSRFDVAGVGLTVADCGAFEFHP